VKAGDMAVQIVPAWSASPNDRTRPRPALYSGATLRPVSTSAKTPRGPSDSLTVVGGGDPAVAGPPRV
ncbi:MAG: hypothetical protein AVDCRST_MAG73-2446, partial [uncultured Thermomicrobiales bacterium]